ncbi:MAG TPA: uroporphyrinogen-III synthase [Bryobacteraceae bacterium]|nr:uroporphyrinogen-III synthase [Bryobacteraceae bacterium]
MSFDGLRILSLESRRAEEIAELIRRQGGNPFVAPSMREIPVDDSAPVFQFADRLFAGQFDMMMFLTGVGTRQLNRVLSSRYPETAFANALRKLTVIARGPKPAAALREMAVPIAVTVSEPNTWREMLAETEKRPERHVAVQEYGRPNPELIDGLRARGADVTSVQVYQYGLPEDAEPLREAARLLAAGQLDVALFTTAVQIVHLAQVAREQGIEDNVLAALRKMWIASIGPTTTEALEEYGLHPDLEPSHPKMGFLVREAAEQAGAQPNPDRSH